MYPEEMVDPGLLEYVPPIRRVKMVKVGTKWSEVEE